MSSANFHWYTAWAITFYLAWFWFNFLFCFFCSQIAINVQNFKFLNFWVAWKTSRYHVNYPRIHAILAESSPIHFSGFWIAWRRKFRLVSEQTGALIKRADDDTRVLIFDFQIQPNQVYLNIILSFVFFLNNWQIRKITDWLKRPNQYSCLP